MFETLERKPPDAILKLIAEFGNDPREEKIDLGVGVYRDAAGDTPVFRAIKQAEQRLLETQTSKSYLGIRGAVEFCEAMQSLVFGEKSRGNERLMTLQTPGGSGALRVAAGVILRANPDTTLWVSDPTWNNHMPLLGGAARRHSRSPVASSSGCASRAPSRCAPKSCCSTSRAVPSTRSRAVWSRT